MKHTEVSLVSVDLKTGNLEEMLNSFARTINQQNKVIHEISEKLADKVSQSELQTVFSSLVHSIPLSQRASPSPVSLSENVNCLSAGLSGLFQEVKAKTSEKNELFTGILEDNSNMKEAQKKLLEKINSKIGADHLIESTNTLMSQIERVEELMRARAQSHEKSLKELEISFSWRLKDCEQLLKSRVSESFVWEAIEARKDKTETPQVDTCQMLYLESKLQDLVSEVENLKTENENHKTNLASELDGREDALKELFIETINSEMATLNNLIRRNRDEISTVKEKNAEIAEKVNEVDEIPDILASIKILQREMIDKVDKDVILSLIEELKQQIPEQKPTVQTAPSTDMNEFWKFRDSMRKKVSKIEKDSTGKIMNLTTLIGELKHVINAKCSENTLDLAVSVLENKFRDSYNELTHDIGKISKELVHIRKKTKIPEPSNGLTLLSTRSISPQTCLSCGVQQPQALPSSLIGADNRAYKSTSNLSSPNETALSKLDKIKVPSYIYDKEAWIMKHNNTVKYGKKYRPQSAYNP